MNAPPKRDEARGEAGSGKAAQQGKQHANPAIGRPEFQGNLNGRNRSQPAPTWPVPAGADAALELARLWGRK